MRNGARTISLLAWPTDNRHTRLGVQGKPRVSVITLSVASNLRHQLFYFLLNDAKQLSHALVFLTPFSPLFSQLPFQIAWVLHPKPIMLLLFTYTPSQQRSHCNDRYILPSRQFSSTFIHWILVLIFPTYETFISTATKNSSSVSHSRTAVTSPILLTRRRMAVQTLCLRRKTWLVKLMMMRRRRMETDGRKRMMGRELLARRRRRRRCRRTLCVIYLGF